MKIASCVLTIAALGGGFTSCGYAQGYPVKAIRLIVPYPPGGGTDVIARPLAQKLSENLGQQVIVDNRGGAGGSIGMEYVAKSAPDGYTLVVGLTAQLAVNPSLFPKLPYDPVKDFAPITLLGEQPYLLLVHPSVPAKSVKEFVTLARAHPGQLAYASSGNGSGAHLAGEMLKTMAHIDLVHVPYKGAGQAMPDFHQRFTMAAVAPIGSTPEQLGEHIKSEIARWAKLVRQSGARID